MPRDWQRPGHMHKSPRETRLLKGLMVREVPVAAKRRLWLIICSQLKGEENKPFVCPNSLPPCPQLPLPLLLEPGRRWGTEAALGDSDSSLRQQDKEDSLEEVTKAANSGHKPVGAKAGVGVHHAFCDVCLMRREQRSSERDAQNHVSHRCRLSRPHNPRHRAPTAAAHFATPSTATNACSDTSTHCKMLNQV